MNGKDILKGLSYIDQHYIAEAETYAPPERKIRTLRRPLLLAAIIALMLMLVGCSVAYLLHLQEIKLGEDTIFQDIFGDPHSEDAFDVIGQKSDTRQVLTLAGLGGTPVHQAAREWYDFRESYDPDGSIRRESWGTVEFPEEYSGYGLYSQEMKDKLDEILAKYNLKLRGKAVEFQSTKLLLRALGMETVLNPAAEAQLSVSGADYYENGNLDLTFSLTLPAPEGEPPARTHGEIFYRSKDCFIPDTAVLTEADWEEWNYTTPSGAEVLILRAEESASAWIFCDLPRYTVSAQINSVLDLYEELENGVPVVKTEILTQAQLEQAADAIDFSLEPQLVEGWETLSDNAVPAGQSINGYTVEPISAFTDGYAYQIVLQITAPEGIALTDPEDTTAQIEPLNGPWGRCLEDGDGKLNTCHYILSDAVDKEDCPEDGSYPYPQGNVISVYWEDLYFTRYDFENYQTVYTLLTEGTWKFNIPLTEADTREIELLTAPITAEGCYGWSLDGTDATADYEVTSFKLRAMGIDVIYDNTGREGSADFFCFNRQPSYVVMQDGTWMEFTYHRFDRAIDLDQVAYVQLADKTILPMPGMEEEEIRILSEVVQAAWDATFVPAPVFEDGIELLTEPITMASLGGYATDATGDMEPLYEYLHITSIILHSEGLAIFGPAAFDLPEDQATVYLSDGTQILLTGMGGAPYCDEPLSQLKAETPIDLSKAERILLPDGTELPIPQN